MCYDALEDLLTYIECHFSKYFDQETKVPESYLLMADHEFLERLSEIEKSLKHKQCDKALITIATRPLRDFIKRKFIDDITFWKLMYIKELFRELRQCTEKDLTGEEFTRYLMEVLIYLNFNDYAFFGFATGYIKRKYAEQDTLEEQIHKLAWCHKFINQFDQKPNMAYHRDRNSIKQNLIGWIADETEYLEHTRQLTLNLPSNSNVKVGTDFKIITGLSVPVLAYLIKVLVEIGVIQNRNNSALIKFVANVVGTKRVETISPESLRSKYYNVDQKTRDSLKDIVLQMLNEIRKNK